METEPMALATGVDFATVLQMTPEASASGKCAFYQANPGGQKHALIS